MISYTAFYFLVWCGFVNFKSKYLTSAFLLLLTSVIVKIIGAVYKIPLTAFIGAVGRGYFAAAYNLYMPLHALTMGAFPIALSKLVSKYNASNNKQMIVSLKKGSLRLFSLVGLGGMIIILILAKPYSVFIASSPKSIYTILVLAPSILFSCLASAYRGYYEGFMNMVPTSVSQMIEAFFKMIFGLLFAKLSISYMYNMYIETGCVFGHKISCDEEALSFIYPFTSAAAMLGVSLGSAVSLIYVLIYYKINNSERLYYSNFAVHDAQKELLSFSFPIMISCAVQSVFQFLDTASVQYSLGNVDPMILYHEYSGTDLAAGDLVTYSYGLLSTALDFKNLVPGITMALGVCAVPAISSAFELKDKVHLENLSNSIVKYTALLSCFGGGFMALCSRDILTLFYGSSSPDIVLHCDKLVWWMSVSVFVFSLAGTAVFCVQAIGCPEKSIKPYVVSGIIRVVLNLVLIQRENLLLYGFVISGAAGYFVMWIWNMIIYKRAANVKISIFKNVIKPITVAVISYLFTYFMVGYFNLPSSTVFKLLITLSIFCAFFCILSFMLNLLDFKEIIKYKNCKKNSSNT